MGQQSGLIPAHLAEQTSHVARTTYKIHAGPYTGYEPEFWHIFAENRMRARRARISLGRRASQRPGPYRVRSRQRLRG
jgi:hypothetical protein